MKTEQSLYLVHVGKALKPRAAYCVTVEVTDNTGDTASAEGIFEMGLMNYRSMKADWIAHAFADDLEPCAVFERSPAHSAGFIFPLRSKNASRFGVRGFESTFST